MILLTRYPQLINPKKRIIGGFSLFTLSTFGLIVLDLATNGKGGSWQYAGVLAMVACFGIADAASFLAGVATSGALTSGLMLITKAALDNRNDDLNYDFDLRFVDLASSRVGFYLDL
ncbi:hypothetical protein ACFE04_001185 [Oxalis oulophora]